ncbi:MAG TPA: SH3 domain-containing protein [Spirochaetota bacterium]|nr:SH3 domain-containing protein [Spirochaetota bacterium]HOD14305.1 SH3 domain-containing protein [Spirochaetota bacterium]HPG51270.1 SH3 domain-containing protein [Spirochaetota bacterium]HPN14238.1 SH3 domain-containing protein [Spirochaetota bacterium]
MKKGAIIGIIIAVAAVAITIAGYFIFSKDDLESAISEFEDGDYEEAIIRLNRLAKTADYDTGEKIYYYRCRAINGLATGLEDKYADELAEIASEKKDTEDYRETKKDLEGRLAVINRKTEGDLTLVPAMKKSRIVPRGKFYDEFAARYRGSSLIEDLQFEGIQNMGKTDPEKLVPAMINFYTRYPNTDYLSNMVRILFDGLQNGSLTATGNEEILWEMICAYVKRYPTSPETGKLHTCVGENVNMRNSPGVNGKLVGKIARDEILLQLEKSMDTSQVGDVRDYWYRVASLKGPRGWIFGKFLKPVDLSRIKESTPVEEKWTMDEQFADWGDSHTPANWTHVPGSDTAGINFSMKGGKKFAEINSVKGAQTGLFSRYNATRAFTITSRARLAGGDALTVFAYVPGTEAFYVRLTPGQVVVSGRTIPIATAEWHDYTLTSDDGRYASLIIDGETVSSRIEPLKNTHFITRGIYCLYSSKDENSKGEMEFIRAR